MPAATEAQLRGRIAELEALLEARTQTIVALSATVVDLQANGATSTSVRLRQVERELDAVNATKLMRYAAVPRRLYGRLRGSLGRG